MVKLMHDFKQNLLNASFYVAEKSQKERLSYYCSAFCSVHSAGTCIIETLERLSLGLPIQYMGPSNELPRRTSQM